jgi:hypothetical protein
MAETHGEHNGIRTRLVRGTRPVFITGMPRIGPLCFPWTMATPVATFKRASIGSFVSGRAYGRVSCCTSAAGVLAPARPGSSSGGSA